jgi:RNA polymerase sigma-70 factor (ECF subfamily)
MRPRVSDSVAPPQTSGKLSDEIVGFMPVLRIYARSLCRNAADSDDLVQETMVRAIANAHRFQRGTNLRAWLFTIMRNRFYSDWAKRSRERTGDKDCVADIPSAPENPQMWYLEMRELVKAIDALPVQFRETIILVAALGESYVDAAERLDCDIGTIKSRVHRARNILRQNLARAG